MEWLEQKEKLIDVLNWRRKQIRGLRFASQLLRYAAGLIATYFAYQIIPLLVSSVTGEWQLMLTLFAEGAAISTSIWALGLLLGAASELLSDSTYLTARMRLRDEQQAKSNRSAPKEEAA